MSTEHLTDEKAVQLLNLLKDYVRDGIARGEELDSLRDLRVKDVAGDLIDSLPRTMIPSDCRFFADSLS